MGAIPCKNGVGFRVWAPNADKVYVQGTFNKWSKRHPLKEEENGYWYTNASKAKIGDEYKFLIVNGENELERIDPYARNVTSSVGNGIVEQDDFDWGKDQDFQMPPWNELVIYEMHIGTFNNPTPDTPGDFQNAIDKLFHLEELGINAIQIMPPLEFPGGFSWGYNPAHPFAIESDYGGPRALKRLIKAAHASGIAVLVDVVYNHFGPSDLDLWQFDGWQENGKGGIYFYNDWRAETPWGATRPDYGRPEVRQYIRDNVMMWLHEYHVDGLRWDATSYIRNVFGNDNDPSSDISEGWSLMQWINEEIQSHNPATLSIAEDLQGNEWVTKEIGAGGAGFGAQWASEFVHTIREAMIVPDDAMRNVHSVAGALSSNYNGSPFERVIYTESHDEVANGSARLPEEIYSGQADSWFSKKRSTLGAALVFTAPGIPMIFQGQEFLEDEWFRDKDPLDWSKTEKFSGILDLYTELIRLRRNLNETTKGLTGSHIEVMHQNNESKVLVYHRWHNGGPTDSTVVVANLSNMQFDSYPIELPNEGDWYVRFNSDAKIYDDEFSNVGDPQLNAERSGEDGSFYSGSIALGPYSVVILSQES